MYQWTAKFFRKHFQPIKNAVAEKNPFVRNQQKKGAKFLA